MKNVFVKRMAVAGVALLSVPALALAQKAGADKEEKVQTIVITRTGDSKGKTVIEIDGDKIKVDGKDAKDSKDVHVNVNTISGEHGIYRFNSRTPGAGSWSYNFNEDSFGEHFSIFDEDDKRAMLGVNTEYTEKGARVVSVTPEGAAQKAGLQKGDIITKINGKAIDENNDITKVVRQHKPNDKVKVAYLRDGKEKEVEAQLTKWKGVRMNGVSVPKIMDLQPAIVDEVPVQGYRAYFGTGRPKLGLSIQDSDDGKGVKVLEVDEESNAAKAGLKENDVILSIDDKEIKGTDDVTRIVRENREKYTFTFKIQRNGKTENLEVKMPRRLKTADL